jgi:hypothetical protein
MKNHRPAPAGSVVVIFFYPLFNSFYQDALCCPNMHFADVSNSALS